MVKGDNTKSEPTLPPQEFKLGSELPHNSKITYTGLLVIVLAFMVFFGLYGVVRKQKVNIPDVLNPKNTKVDIKKFEDEAEFKGFLQASANLVTSGYGIGSSFRALEEDSSLPLIGGQENVSPFGALNMEKQVVTDRYSRTNVQVAGIDEPDILKTDGQNIYYSGMTSYIGTPGPILFRETLDTVSQTPATNSAAETSTSSKLIAPDSMPVYKNNLKVVSAFPPSGLGKLSEIDEQGEMLITNNILAIFSYNKISAYDVRDKSKPVSKWSLDLNQDNNSQIVASRLKGGKIYLVAKNTVNEYSPCAIPVFTKGALTIRCTDIYHPGINVIVDSVITAMLVNPENGDIEKKISFVGSTGGTTVYMSQNNLYTTYEMSEDTTTFMYNFIATKASDLFPQSVMEKLKKLNGYELSNSTKLSEFQLILSQYQSSLGNDERLRIENEMQNRMKDYSKEHSRELEKTGIVKVDLEKFEITANGNVPGHVLNQFSMDEYKNNLRIATTTGGSWRSMSAESFSDVYVMDKDLAKIGEVRNLGVGERIYSVRFINDRGYVVTFRQTDPFYVLDLSSANDPKKVGELKIPGFSSYLHPLKEDLILGVGQESGQVKLSVFDVSNAANPVELYKYNLSDGWSEVQSNHHAFLNDPKNQIFFIPGGLGGYVFSYNNNLTLKKAFAGYAVRRALYINNYFYVVGDSEILVYNQSDWTSLNSLKLN